MTLDSSAVITLCIFMIVHLGGTIWWMSKIQTTLSFIGLSVGDLVKTVAAHEATYAKKEDQAKEFAYRDKQIEAIWKRLDQPHACPNGGCK